MIYRHIQNTIVVSVPLPNRIILSVSARRYPTRSLHTNRQLEILAFLLAGKCVCFWDEVLS